MSHRLAKRDSVQRQPCNGSFEKLTAPSQGDPLRERAARRRQQSDHSLHPRGRHGRGHLAPPKGVDAAVAKAYGGSKTIEWFKVYAGDEACDLYGTYQYLPEDTLEGPCLRRRHQRPPHHACGRQYPFAERSSAPDLYSLLRASLPLLRRHPQPPQASSGSGRLVYQENTEDIYMGVEWEADDAVGQELHAPQRGVIPANGKLGKRQIPGDPASASNP